MKINDSFNLNQSELTELKGKIKPFLAGICFTSGKITIGNKKIEYSYQAAGDVITIANVTIIKMVSITDVFKMLIEKKEVVKNNNWYTYQGKKYLGLKRITEAING